MSDGVVLHRKGYGSANIEHRVLITPEEPRGKQYSDKHRVEREGDNLLKRVGDLDPAVDSQKRETPRLSWKS